MFFRKKRKEKEGSKHIVASRNALSIFDEHYIASGCNRDYLNWLVDDPRIIGSITALSVISLLNEMDEPEYEDIIKVFIAMYYAIFLVKDKQVIAAALRISAEDPYAIEAKDKILNNFFDHVDSGVPMPEHNTILIDIIKQSVNIQAIRRL